MDEEESDTALEAQIKLMRARDVSFDTLLSQSNAPSATDIGTATHTFLEFCDFSNLRKQGVDAERDRLVSLGFLSADTAKLLNRKQLEKFIQSDLLAQILSAKRVRREQKFSLLLPMSAFTRDPIRQRLLEQERLFVQGSIDLLLEDAYGTLTLVDYKTDRITASAHTDPNQLVEDMLLHHESQLKCYALAVRQLFGKAPEQILIYSLPLGRAIPLPISQTV